MKNLEMQKRVFDESDSDLDLLSGGAYDYNTMKSKSRIKSVIFLCLFLVISGIVGFGYFCPDQVCALSRRDPALVDSTPLSPDEELALYGLGGSSLTFPRRGALDARSSSAVAGPADAIFGAAGLSYEEVLRDDFQFDMQAHDVMVFLHIQKTGGTSFGRHLVRDLDLKRPCSCQRNKKRCYCFRPNRKEIWLFSRYSTGWRCGLHADWTELTNCVDQELDKIEGTPARRRYFYVTLLREPVARYLSEYRHVQRGATWKNSRHWCNGHNASVRELPPCYHGPTWHGVDLDSFMACPSNLAANRQTRMLADLALVGCYNTSAMSKTERDRLMLESAKRNLASMAYFGLTEHQKVAQYVFEETFNMRFAIPFDQHNATVSSAALNSVTSEQARKIRELNSLDIQLYAFAKQLMFQRFDRLKAKDSNFEQRFAHLGELASLRNGVTEFDWDNNLEEITTPYKTL